MTRQFFLRVLPWLVGAGLLILIFRSVSIDEVIEVLRRLQLWQIGALLIANAFILLTITGRWWILLGGLGHNVPFLPLFIYRLAAFGLSYFTPGPHVGGEVLQVVMVEREHGVSRSDSLAAVALDKAIEYSINLTFLILGIVAILQWRIVPQELGQQAIGLALALLVLPLFYLIVTALGHYPATRIGRPLARRWPRLNAAVNTVEGSEVQVGRYFQRAPKAFILAVGVTLIGWAALIFEYWLTINFLGIQLTLPQLVAALTAARLSILMFLPAGLGALEATQVTVFNLLGLDPAVGISASLLIRLRDTALGLLGLWWWSGRRIAVRRKAADQAPRPVDSQLPDSDYPTADIDLVRDENKFGGGDLRPPLG